MARRMTEREWAQLIARAVFHGWVRQHVPNNTRWQDCSPPQAVLDAYERL